MRTPASLFVALLASLASAQAPPGYYNPVDAANPATLRQTLHGVIDDHDRIPYTSFQTDTWDVLEQAMEDPSNSSRIIDVYLNESYLKQGGGNGFYDREHTWPSSYGFPNDVNSNYPFTDCHQLFLCDGSYNTSRSNKPYRNCNASHLERGTMFTNGQGGGTGVYPGNSNWTSGSNTSGAWETWIERRGDVARALFYLDVRYEGGTHGITGSAEPDLILTDNESLIGASNTGSNQSVAYMGMLSVLLQWHLEDPVDARELMRNDVIFSYQGNRNPFIDHPEWVACVFSGACAGDMVPPTPPAGVAAFGGLGFVDVLWVANSEPDLAGYDVYRSTVAGGPYSQVNGSLITIPVFTDANVASGTTYYYVVTATDTSQNVSTPSGEANATTSGSPPDPSNDPWINELHYDNAGGDTGEFVEIAGPAEFDLSGWQLLGYDGNGGVIYETVDLGGTIPNQGNCLGTIDFSIDGLQDGPDGLALVDPFDNVVLFISYEGEFTATNGPAQGMSSVDIGVTEDSSTPVGSSLQLGAAGTVYDDFAWQPALADTPGQGNLSQTFQDACPPGSTTSYCVTSPNSVGPGATISSTGTTSIAANDFTLVASGATPTEFGIFFYGSAQIQVPFGDGVRCVGAGGGSTHRLNPAQSTDVTGDTSRLVDFTFGPASSGEGAITPGSTWNFQFWYRDPAVAGGSGFNLSNGLEATFLP